MTGDNNIDPGLLRSHSGVISAIADDVGMAADAAVSVDIHGGAFGLLCNVLPPLIGPLESAVESAISGAETEVRNTTTGLNTVATTFENQDELSGDEFDGIDV
jgi:hypothetical protein